MSDSTGAFRSELRSWLKNNLDPDLRADRVAQLPDGERVAVLRRWQARLAADRWVAITWPRAYGGRDATIAEQIAYVEEMTRAAAPPAVNGLGIGIVGPPILAFGTEEQKRHFAPKILDAEHIWCCGFSEPGAGSDLASLRTLALLDGDEFVVNGQKVWTSLAQHADWCMVFCRTDPESKRRNGVSVLLVDMKSPGITVRPLRQINGQAEFNEVFFEDVRVPRANLLGELHNGWQIVTSALQNERGIMYVVEMQIALKRQRDEVVRLIRDDASARRDPLIRQKLADLYLGVETFRSTCQRTLAKLLRAGMPGPEASIIKLHWTKLTQTMPTVSMGVLGPYAQLYDAPQPGERSNPAQWVQASYLGAPAASIASGTTEIMKGIIAMQVLGLPRGA
jgi:alkylation response protein AidB-like acyl-CoA dehydrogenase